LLSRVSFLILGIIKEKPVNPYEINKLLDVIKIKEWFPVASSSVYATIKVLHSKGYIIGENVKEGNMPEKTVYSITDKGELALNQTMINVLSSSELDAVAFNIATIFMCQLDKAVVLDLLENRLSKIQDDLKALEEQYQYYLNIEKVPAYAIISLKHNTYLYEAECKTTLELIEEVKSNMSWDHFLSKRDE
jgi:DNA-binding PadR family transcriptional regulator